MRIGQRRPSIFKGGFVKNSKIVEEFARVFLLAPQLVGICLEDTLKGSGYELHIVKKAVPKTEPVEDHLYLWPMSTAEKGVAVK